MGAERRKRCDGPPYHPQVPFLTSSGQVMKLIGMIDVYLDLLIIDFYISCFFILPISMTQNTKLTLGYLIPQKKKKKKRIRLFDLFIC